LSFLHPEFLYFMLIPLFVLFALLLTQKELQEHFFAQDVMDRLRVSANALTLKARNGLFLLMGIFMIVALAQPVIDDGVVKIKAKSADIMVAFDISDSMLAQDVYPSRLKLAKQKAMEFLRESFDERVGVVAFAKNSYLLSPMSFDHEAVGFLLSNLDTNFITEKGTDFLSMLQTVDKNIKNPQKYLLLITDGGDKEDFTKEIEYAKEANIKVFILGVGTKKGAPIKQKDGSFIKYNDKIVISKLNESIADLATSTGGVYMQNTTSNKDIKMIIDEINAKSIKKELKSEEVHRYIPLFYYPLGVALILLLIATSSIRFKTKGGVVAVLLLLSFVSPHAKAGVFDFVELNKAKKAYEEGKYKEAETLYKKYAKDTNNAQSYYNMGNALYKQKKYKEALKAYSKANFTNNELKAKTLANIGNAHAKQMSMEELQKAKDAYENSLKLKEDKDVRENLKEVKKLLKQQKQKQKQQNKDKKNDKKKNDKNNKNKKNKQQNKNNKKDSKNSKDKNNKDKKDKQQNKNNKKDTNSKKQQNKQDKKDTQDKKNKQQKGDDERKRKDDLKRLSKDKTESKSTSLKKQKLKKSKMSDAEEKKYLKMLNEQKTTYLYRLNNQKPQKRGNDEKPW